MFELFVLARNLNFCEIANFKKILLSKQFPYHVEKDFIRFYFFGFQTSAASLNYNRLFFQLSFPKTVWLGIASKNLKPKFFPGADQIIGCLPNQSGPLIIFTKLKILKHASAGMRPSKSSACSSTQSPMTPLSLVMSVFGDSLI